MWGEEGMRKWEQKHGGSMGKHPCSGVGTVLKEVKYIIIAGLSWLEWCQLWALQVVPLAQLTFIKLAPFHFYVSCSLPASQETITLCIWWVHTPYLWCHPSNNLHPLNLCRGFDQPEVLHQVTEASDTVFASSFHFSQRLQVLIVELRVHRPCIVIPNHIWLTWNTKQNWLRLR